jgi:hypothetical protein
VGGCIRDREYPLARDSSSPSRQILYWKEVQSSKRNTPSLPRSSFELSSAGRLFVFVRDFLSRVKRDRLLGGQTTVHVQIYACHPCCVVTSQVDSGSCMIPGLAKSTSGQSRKHGIPRRRECATKRIVQHRCLGNCSQLASYNM